MASTTTTIITCSLLPLFFSSFPPPRVHVFVFFIFHRLNYLGRLPLEPALTNTCNSRFQQSTREQSVKFSLQSACRYELTKIRAKSYLINASAFCFAMDASDYTKKIYLPALSTYAQMYSLQRKGLLPAGEPIKSPLLLGDQDEFYNTWVKVCRLPSLGERCQARLRLAQWMNSSVHKPLDKSLWQFVSYGMHQF